MTTLVKSAAGAAHSKRFAKLQFFYFLDFLITSFCPRFMDASFFKRHNILIKNQKQIHGIRQAGHLAAKILNETCKLAKEGITTLELNNFAHKLHLDAGAIPAPLNYGHPPFPKSICTSINNVICHGIPNDTALEEGDILNIDVSCWYKGYYGDCSRMVSIGKTSPQRKALINNAYECMMKAINKLHPGLPISIIGEEIEKHAALAGYSIVREFVGHGTGIHFHEGPQIPHYYNKIDIPLTPGMTFTIEPMINEGSSEAIVDPFDKWTARTSDGKSSAQCEHTLLITETGYEILTPWDK